MGLGKNYPLAWCSQSQSNNRASLVGEMPIAKKRPAVPKGIAGLWLCTERFHASHLIAKATSD